MTLINDIIEDITLYRSTPLDIYTVLCMSIYSMQLLHHDDAGTLVATCALGLCGIHVVDPNYNMTVYIHFKLYEDE